MPLTKQEWLDLEAKANQLRHTCLDTTLFAGSGHIGGSLSSMDILTILYYKYMNVKKEDPDWEDRDRFILSKGHIGIGYAGLLCDMGWNDPEQLKTFNLTNSKMGVHLDSNKVKGVDASTGSLGHGLSIAVGTALAARVQGKDYKTYCLLGDGECDEGSNWEAAMSAAQFNTTNMISFVDRNRLMMDGPTEDEMKLEPFADKWTAFGFEVIEVDGHNFKELADAIDRGLAATEKPVMIIANTVKGCGIDFMENQYKWHYGAIDQDLHDKAAKSLDDYYAKRVARVEKGEVIMAGGLVYTAVGSEAMATAEYYGKAMCELGKEHPEVVALTADLAGSTKIGVFGKEFPERFFDVGIAEQNMFGIAAGMAKAGLVPFVSTMSAFATMRVADQIHADICYQNANVKIIGSHAGTSFGQAGSTHHAIVDMGCLLTFPNMTYICPADGMETVNAIRAAYETPGPVYIRINRGFDRILNTDTEYGFQLGKAHTVHEGTDITVIACGSCVYQALQAAKSLEATDGIKVRVLNMHTLKPLDVEAVQKAIVDTRRIITAEDHTVINGLGSAVADVIADYGKGCAFKKLGHPDKFAPIGLHEDIMSMVGIDANGIIDAVREVMHKDFEEDDSWDDEV